MSDQTPVSQRELDRNVRENERLEKKMKGIQVATPLSVLINVTSVGVCTFAFGRKKGVDGINDLHPTYFTPNSSLLGLYWAVLYFLMVGFSVLVVISRKKETKQLLTSSIGPNLAIANFFMALWAPLWILNQHWSFLAGEVLLCINALLLLWSSVVLGVWWSADFKHPADWMFVHLPIKMFFAVTFQLDIWQQLFIVLKWDNGSTISNSIWPTFIIQVSIAILFSLWIFSTTDVTLAVLSIYLNICVLRYKKVGISDRPAELLAGSILSIALLSIAVFGNLAWSRLQGRREGRIALPVSEEEEERIERENQRVRAGRDEEERVEGVSGNVEGDNAAQEDGTKVTRRIGSEN